VILPIDAGIMLISFVMLLPEDVFFSDLYRTLCYSSLLVPGEKLRCHVEEVFRAGCALRELSIFFFHGSVSSSFFLYEKRSASAMHVLP
jgi:hypothetical protein